MITIHPIPSHDYQWLPMTTDDYWWLPMTTDDYRWLLDYIVAKGVKISTDQFSPPKKLAPKKRLFFACFRVFSPVFRMLFPKISTGQKKIALTGAHGPYVFATLWLAGLSWLPKPWSSSSLVQRMIGNIEKRDRAVKYLSAWGFEDCRSLRRASVSKESVLLFFKTIFFLLTVCQQIITT